MGCKNRLKEDAKGGVSVEVLNRHNTHDPITHPELLAEQARLRRLRQTPRDGYDHRA